jgi:hypothetical protein
MEGRRPDKDQGVIGKKRPIIESLHCVGVVAEQREEVSDQKKSFFFFSPICSTMFTPCATAGAPGRTAA